MNPVGNDVWCACHNEFARFWFAGGAAEMGMRGKAFHGGEYALRYATCCCGLILFNISPNFDEVGDGV